MVKEYVFRPNQIRLHKSKFKQNTNNSEEYSKDFLLYYRKEPKEGMPEIFKKLIYEEKKPTSKQTLDSLKLDIRPPTGG